MAIFLEDSKALGKQILSKDFWFHTKEITSSEVFM